jgi:hypothetical protein
MKQGREMVLPDGTHLILNGVALERGGESPVEEAREMWTHFIRRVQEQKHGPN